MIVSYAENWIGRQHHAKPTAATVSAIGALTTASSNPMPDREVMHVSDPQHAAIWQALTAPRCPECKCLWDDHQRPEDVDDGIPFALAASGETDMTQVITCGDCGECTEVRDG